MTVNTNLTLQLLMGNLDNSILAYGIMVSCGRKTIMTATVSRLRTVTKRPENISGYAEESKDRLSGLNLRGKKLPGLGVKPSTVR